MPTSGVTNRKMKEILRLYHEANLSMHQIAKSLNLSSGVVYKYLKKAKLESIKWPLPEHIKTDHDLEVILKSKSTPSVEEVDFSKASIELKRKGVTLCLLWEEYTRFGLTTLSYSQFCRRYRTWKSKQPISMRQTHIAGDKVFIDYSGMTFDVIDPETGEIRAAQIFIGVLGASGYTYAEATWTQQLDDWIGSHVRMFEFFGGVPNLLVPDNLKSAVHKACKYDPDINPSYAELVMHYNTAVLPARPYKPKDKAKAEAGVQLVQRWILARLRNETFMGLDELNLAIRKYLKVLNTKPFKKQLGSRLEVFMQLEQAALKPLPKTRFEFKHYKQAKVNIDYHIELMGHYYSVPYRYIGERVDIWYNHVIVEAFYNGQRISIHQRANLHGKHTTLPEHMPKSHQAQAKWSKERFINWAKGIGTYTTMVIEQRFEQKQHEEQAFRSCLGILNLAKTYSNQRLEAACHYAYIRNICSRKSIVSIIEKGIDQQPLLEAPLLQKTLTHENIRGAHYYH
jgi:transposase